MGLFYKTMIKEINEEFKRSKDPSLEHFLKEREESFKKKYQLGDLLFYLNIMKVFEENNQDSDYFRQKNLEAHEEDSKFDSFQE